jgi:hypothetical protein
MVSSSPHITRQLAAFVHDAPVGCASARAIEVIKDAIRPIVQLGPRTSARLPRGWLSLG